MVPQPHTVNLNNQGMGGVDLHDNAIANYRIRIRDKEWWWPLFANGLDSSMVNAWKIYKVATGSTISQIDFRSEVALCLLKKEESEGATTLKLTDKNSLPNAIRKDKVGHNIVRDAKNARRSCRVCSIQTPYAC